MVFLQVEGSFLSVLFGVYIRAPLYWQLPYEERSQGTLHAHHLTWRQCVVACLLAFWVLLQENSMENSFRLGPWGSTLMRIF